MARAASTPASAAPATTPTGGRRLRVTQTRSKIGGTSVQRDTLRSLGLRRIGTTVVIDDRPELRGMVDRVSHLVRVEEVEGS